ncbi:MAG: hypothetical protein U0U66_02680 [Cytophagaceae bacterium]
MYPESFHVTSFLGTTKIEARHYPYRLTWVHIVLTLAPLWILSGIMIYYYNYYYAGIGLLLVAIVAGIIWYIQAQAKSFFMFHKSRLEVAEKDEKNIILMLEYKHIKEVYVDILEGEVLEGKATSTKLQDTFCLMVKTNQQEVLVTNKLYYDETMFIAKMLKDRMTTNTIQH